MWRQLYRIGDLHDVDQVRSEALRQLELFRQMLGADPTHLDSHQHVHLRAPVLSIATGIAAQLRIPLRHCSPHVAYCGEFYGQDERGEACPQRIQIGSLLRILQGLQPGATELACHPGYAEDLATMYRDERKLEIVPFATPLFAEH